MNMLPWARRSQQIELIPSPPTTYLFVDAGYLLPLFSSFTKAWFGREAMEALDVVKMMKIIAIKGWRRSYYYDCEVVQRKNEPEDAFIHRQRTQLQSWSELTLEEGCHVRKGHLTGKPLRQKEVDILLAVDMLSIAAKGGMHKALLVAGDRDFAPLISEVVNLDVMVEVIAAKESCSEKLKMCADKYRPIDPIDPYHWMKQDYIDQHRLPTSRHQPALIGTCIEAGTLRDGSPVQIRVVETPKGEEYHTRSQQSEEWDWVHTDKLQLTRYLTLTLGPVTWDDIGE